MANGVPPLLNQIANIGNIATLLIADSILIANLFNPLSKFQWGIFYSGLPIVEPDSIVSFEFKNEWNVPTFPIEQGGFQNYNKIATPFETRITMTKGGSETDKLNFLKDVENIGKSLVLYDIVTPTRTYNNASVIRYDYSRTSTNGVGLLTVNLTIVEIRQAPAATLSNSSTVQPTQATATQASVAPGT